MRVRESNPTSSLRDLLRAEYNKLSSIVSSGMVPSATAANAHSVSYSEPGKGTTTPGDKQTMWGYLIELYDTIAASLPEPVDDDDVYSSMLLNLQPARFYRNDYSCLRAV